MSQDELDNIAESIGQVELTEGELDPEVRADKGEQFGYEKD